MKLGTALEEYLRRISIHMSAGSVKAYRSRLRYLRRFSERELENIRLVDIQDLVAAYRKGRSNATTRLMVSAVRSFFDWCEAVEYLEHSPAKRLKAPPRDQHVPRALSRSTSEQIITICEKALSSGGWRDVRNATLILALLLAGLRRAEATSLRWRDIDLGGKVLIVMGKGRKERRIPLHGRLTEALQKLRRCQRRSGSVFCREDGEPLSLTAVNQIIFGEWLEPRLGQHITPHQLRHTFATLIVECGGSMDEVRDLLGHNSVATTQVYVAKNPERLRAAVERLQY